MSRRITVTAEGPDDFVVEHVQPEPLATHGAPPDTLMLDREEAVSLRDQLDHLLRLAPSFESRLPSADDDWG